MPKKQSLVGFIGLLCVCLSVPLAHAQKIIFIDSYHADYPWSRGLLAGIEERLTDSAVELKVHRMDTKRNRGEKAGREAAVSAKAAIDEFQPDVIISCDDNASKYLIEPEFKNGPVPVVFCGVNWDASVYGFPTPYVTGMVEVEPVNTLIKQLKKFAGGNKVGFLALDSLSEHVTIKQINMQLGIGFDDVRLVNNYEEWKSAYLDLQDKVDVLLVSNFSGMQGWNAHDFKQVVRQHTRIPTGSTNAWVKDYVLITMDKIPEEQGRWAADAALQILSGKSVSDIPLSKNQQNRLRLNMTLADKLGIVFDISLIDLAEIFFQYENKTIVHIDSYSRDYIWSRGINDGIADALKNTGVRLLNYEMDTKKNTDKKFIKQAAAKAKSFIEKNKPDVVIASDDNASKFLIQPYFKNVETPVVFCGVNWDASVYGYPYKNATGMVEVDMASELYHQLLTMAEGSRVGFLGTNVLSFRKVAQYLREKENFNFEKIYEVNTQAEWMDAYARAQQEVDVLIVSSTNHIKDWDHFKAVNFIKKTTKVPTGTVEQQVMPYVMLGYTKSPHEQGFWSAQTALAILDGALPAEIPITQNKQQTVYINTDLIKHLNIVLSPSLLNIALPYHEN